VSTEEQLGSDTAAEIANCGLLAMLPDAIPVIWFESFLCYDNSVLENSFGMKCGTTEAAK
jgi:hypothetical protein